LEKFSVSIMLKILTALITTFFISNTFAYTCTDDYIISGGRSIDLLPDKSFEIFQNGTDLIVIRGTLVLKFSHLEIIESNKIQIKRYSLTFTSDKYYFDLINDKNEWQWEQYASGSSKRGFGGECHKNDKH
jgi:hypothetical protein